MGIKWYDEKRDGGLGPWEKTLKAELVQQYDNSDYLEMLVGYCHEDLYLARASSVSGVVATLPRKAKYCACICSATGYGETIQEAIRDLADQVIEKVVEKNMLGC